MSEPTKLDEFHFHEALDRAVALADIADTMLGSHAVIKQYPELEAKLRQIVEAATDLGNCVQAIGEKELAQ